MKLQKKTLFVVIVTFALGTLAFSADLTTAFTYQGRLLENGSPATGTYDFTFSLYDASAGGNQVGSTLTLEDVSVDDGLFTVELDFGSVFGGQRLWLEVGVRPGSSTGPFTTLSPRQEITAAPNAMWSMGSWSITGNNGTDPSSNWLGTVDFKALEIKVYSRRAVRIEPALSENRPPNVIIGYRENSVTNGVEGAVIGGGGYRVDASNLNANEVTDNYGTVAGGAGNRAGDGDASPVGAICATVSGGFSNTASGRYSLVSGGLSNTSSGQWAAVAGGEDNQASADYAFVGGGHQNTSSAFAAAVAGGDDNTASGQYAFVGGGYGNQASGDYSVVAGGSGSSAAGDHAFAAGLNAHADQNGCFVWGDSTTSTSVQCTADNQTVFRSAGGYYFYTNSALTSGAVLPPNSGSWSSLSDRSSKEDVEPVDPEEVLSRLSHVPVFTWRYEGEAASIRHMGPMAQDLYAAFGLGASDRFIATVDADGIALAAIQGLNNRLEEVLRENERLKAEVGELRKRLEKLEAAISLPTE